MNPSQPLIPLFNVDARPIAERLRFSGHESFACRYAWLPKAHRLLSHDPFALGDEERAMVELGVGKNMVRSIRFWVEAFAVAAPQPDRALRPTAFAHTILDDDGHDPFLEDPRTLWLLHWHLASNPRLIAFAWWTLVSLWPRPEFTRSQAIEALMRDSQRLNFRHSRVTLEQHFDVFLRTYTSARGGGEETLDCPLSELGLIEHAGERRGERGQREPVYAFRIEAKPEITPALFEYCLEDHWRNWRPTEATLTAREIATGAHSVGQLFRLPEGDVRDRLDAFAAPGWMGPFAYKPSAVQGSLMRNPDWQGDLLAQVYALGGQHG